MQIVGLLLFPFMAPTAFGRVTVSVFGAIVLVLALWTVRSTPALTWVSMLIGIPGVVLVEPAPRQQPRSLEKVHPTTMRQA